MLEGEVPGSFFISTASSLVWSVLDVSLVRERFSGSAADEDEYDEYTQLEPVSCGYEVADEEEPSAGDAVRMTVLKSLEVVACVSAVNDGFWLFAP